MTSPAPGAAARGALFIRSALRASTRASSPATARRARAGMRVWRQHCRPVASVTGASGPAPRERRLLRPRIAQVKPSPCCVTLQLLDTGPLALRGVDFCLIQGPIHAKLAAPELGRDEIAHMWSDNEATLDLLGFNHLIEAICAILNRNDLLPATIGVFGDWGSGKSSLIGMVRELLEEDDETLVLSFNGWLFEGYEDAKLALMGTIVDELAEHKKLTVKAKGLIVGLAHRINLWRVAMAGARIAAGYAAGDLHGAAMGAAVSVPDLLEKAKDVEPDKLKEFLKKNDPGQQLRRGVREFRKDFTELLEETKVKRLVVIVDDLDRCTPDTVIETLEAIKLFLFVPNTAFIIGADERLIRYAVRRRFPELPGERADVGRDYLEKLIQFPVRIPALGRGETETYVKLLLAKLCILEDDAYGQLRECGLKVDASVDASLDRVSVEKALGGKPDKDLDEALSLGDQIAPVLAAGLMGNPRQCKRFLNTLLMRLEMARAKEVTLKRRTLAKLMLLEYMKPESFKELARLQAAQAGKPVELASIERPSAATTTDDKPTDKAVKPKVVAATEPAPGALAAWATDEWLGPWVRSEPLLSADDLRPYFYFAREKLDPLAGLSLRMSPEAQNALAKLLGPTVAERTLVLERAPQMSPADVAAVFETLVSRVWQTETLTMTDGALPRVFEWVAARPDLFGEFITFLKSLPDARVPFTVAPRLAQLASTPDRKPPVNQLLSHWRSNGSSQLKKAATTVLEQLAKN